MVAGKRKPTLRSLTARLLVLGDKGVGKSASIVRYTTGRFIQVYCDTTNDWLYRYPLGYDAKQNLNSNVELLEQKDIQFGSSSNFLATTRTIPNYENASLAARVAMDQLIDNELHEKQEMLNKLHWANAYIVIYAINDADSFNKAIKYLNLIANNINNSQVNDSNNKTNKFFNRLTPASNLDTLQHNSTSGSQGLIGSENKSPFQLNAQSQFPKRPILLLGNKRDLESSGRQVSMKDGRRLAMRHQCLFAEVSIAESSKPIEIVLASLIERIEPIHLHCDHLDRQQMSLNDLVGTTISRWSSSTIEYALSQSGINLAAPVWGNLVKSKPIGSTVVQSSRVSIAYSEPNSRPMVAKPLEVQALRRASAEVSKVSNANSNKGATKGSGRYENFKHSFRKASMVIASGRQLVRGAKLIREQTDQRQELSTLPDRGLKLSDSDLSEEPSIKSVNVPININRRKDNFVAPDKCDSNSTKSEKFRRPLFQYKSRRKTVALEQIRPENNEQLQTCMELGSQTELNTNNFSSGNQTVTKRPNLATIYATSKNSFDRCSSARSSSSLSTSDTYYSPQFVICDSERASSSIGSTSISSNNGITNTNNNNNNGIINGCNNNLSIYNGADMRRSSRSTLSRASTSGGSYDVDDSGDDVPKMNLKIKMRSLPKSASSSIDQGTSKLPPTVNGYTLVNNRNNKRGHQIVKTVQSTLTNLTRSSTHSAQSAKRSFCNALFKYSSPYDAATLRSSATPLIAGLAKTETIQAISVTGYCK